MTKYTALTPIKHDGKRYEEGQEVTLSAADAERLQASGAVQESKDAKGDKPKAKD